MKLSHILAAAALLVATATSSKGAVLISQYYEGTGTNKYIEIINTGSTAIDLGAGAYRIGLWSNTAREGWKTGTTPNSSFALTGTLAPGATLLLGNSANTAPAYAAAADTTSGTLNNVINFNGDDSVVIYTGSSYAYVNVVDAFGAVANNYLDTSYIRNANITTGTNADFSGSDWTQVSLADVANAVSTTNQYLGVHTVVPEPQAATLFGAVGLLGILRRRR